MFSYVFMCFANEMEIGNKIFIDDRSNACLGRVKNQIGPFLSSKVIQQKRIHKLSRTALYYN